MYCTKCGKQINDDGAFCPYCGNPRNGGNNNVSKEVKKEKKKINATIPIIIGLVITFFFFFIVVLGVIALFVGKTLDNGETISNIVYTICLDENEAISKYNDCINNQITICNNRINEIINMRKELESQIIRINVI